MKMILSRFTNLLSDVGKRHYLSALLGYATIILVVFGIAPFITTQKLIFGDDLHLTYYFFRSYFRESVASGVFPWWNPYLFSGLPYAAHPQTLLPFYPVHWLFAIVPTALMFNWYIAGHTLIAMTGMYWLANFFVKKEAAFISGIVFGLSGFFMARIWAGHVDMIAASAYLPVAFGFYWRAMETGTTRRLLHASLSLTLMLFIGYETVSLYALEAIGIAAGILAISQKSIRPLVRYVLATLIGVGLAAIQLVPQQEFLNRSIRSFPFPYEWAAGQHLVKEQLKTLINPFLYGDQRNYTGPWPNLAEYAMYVGLVPLGLAIAALPFALFALIRQVLKSNVIRNLFRNQSKMLKQVRDDKEGGRHFHTVILVLVFSLIAVFALWVSFGEKAPYFDLTLFLWKWVPVYKSLRIPTRQLLLFVFAMSLLTGISLHVLKNRIIITVLGILMLVDLVPFARHFMELRDIPEKRHDPQLIETLKSDTTLFRTMPLFGVWLEPRSSFDFDSAMTYRVFSTNGYDPSILRNYYEFVDAAGGHSSPSFLEHNVQVPYIDVNSPYINFLNTKYIFVPNWLDPLGGVSLPQYTLILDDVPRGYRLYVNREAYGRFYLVPEVKAFPTREALKKAVLSRREDLTKAVLTETKEHESAQSACPPDQASQVSVTSYRPNDITLAVNASCDGYLVSSEVMYPGWEATIDGKPEKVFEGNMAFRTIHVPAGHHTVVYYYNPRIFSVGGLISVLFVLLSFLLYRKSRVLI